MADPGWLHMGDPAGSTWVTLGGFISPTPVAQYRVAADNFGLKREAAPGVDGETWRHYGEALEANLRDLAERLKRGAYRA